MAKILQLLERNQFLKIRTDRQLLRRNRGEKEMMMKTNNKM